MYAGCSEYCQFEAFNATCPKGQLVVVDEARYGRQRLGRCVTRDYGFIGCTANVIDVLDSACTGRTWCEVPVPSLRRRVQPCPKDLTAYLYATYHCIKGTTLVLKLRGWRPHSGVCTRKARGIREREGPQKFGRILYVGPLHTLQCSE